MWLSNTFWLAPFHTLKYHKACWICGLESWHFATHYLMLSYQYWDRSQHISPPFIYLRYSLSCHLTLKRYIFWNLHRFLNAYTFLTSLSNSTLFLTTNFFTCCTTLMYTNVLHIFWALPYMGHLLLLRQRHKVIIHTSNLFTAFQNNILGMLGHSQIRICLVTSYSHIK